MKKALLLFALLYSSAASAQEFTLAQLIAIRGMEDLPAINTYLGDKGWVFGMAAPEENFDQVAWARPRPGQKDAALNVLFCNKCTNPACDKCAVHASGDGAQHAVTLTYQPTRAAFLSLKKEAEANNMQIKTLLYSGALTLVYTGVRYKIMMSEITSDQSPGRYFVDLMARPSEDSETSH